MGIRRKAHEVISYLSYRKLIVRMKDSKNELKNVILNVPQGTILGPLQIILRVNDLLMVMNEEMILS